MQQSIEKHTKSKELKSGAKLEDNESLERTSICQIECLVKGLQSLEI